MNDAKPANPAPRLNLDEPGSATAGTMRFSFASAAVILLLTVIILAFGNRPLTPYPQFVPLHVAFVLILDSVTAYLLYGQFHYRRLTFYLPLAGGYLFSALLSIPFLLSFPGFVQQQSGLIGGSQSAIWLWHAWHILFPCSVVAAFLLDRQSAGRRLSAGSLRRLTRGSITLVLLLVAVLVFVVTALHDHLPRLINVDRLPPLTPAFYWVGGASAVATLAALALAWVRGIRRSTVHLWLGVAMLAFLADILASLGAYERYTVGWYFGRALAILASGVLLFVFLGEIIGLYRRLGTAVHDLAESNRSLVSLLKENQLAKSELAEKNDQLERLTGTDYLTKMPNRRALERELTDLLQLNRRYGRRFSAIMIDIDHFKRINDTQGHNVGDQVLRRLASIISNRVRTTDFAGRWGGEEFLVLCAETALPEAAELAEVLRSRVEQHDFGLAAPLTASFGVAEYDANESRESFTARVDQQLYLAKQQGRNRVVSL